MSISAEDRQAALQSAIRVHLAQGYHVVSQTDFGAQLLRPKRIHPLFAAAMLLLVGFGWVFLIVYYMTLRDTVLYLEVDDAGRVLDAARQRVNWQASPPAEPDAPGQFALVVPALTSGHGRTVAGVGALILVGASFLDWTAPEGKALALCFGGLFLLGVLMTKGRPGHSYSLVGSGLMVLCSLYVLVGFGVAGSAPTSGIVALVGSSVAAVGGWLALPATVATT